MFQVQKIYSQTYALSGVYLLTPVAKALDAGPLVPKMKSTSQPEAKGEIGWRGLTNGNRWVGLKVGKDVIGIRSSRKISGDS